MPKGVIVILVVVAVVFVLTLVVGHNKHGQSFQRGDQPPGIVTAFKGGGNALKIGGDVTSACGNGPQLSFSGGCNITVPSRSSFSRPTDAAFQAVSGATAIRVVPADGDVQGPKIVPNDRACLSSAIDHKGARIELTCTGGGTCVVAIVRSC